MEILAMGPSQHAYNDPSYTGQAPNMFLTNVGRQQSQEPRPSPFAIIPGQFVAQAPGTLSSHSTEFSEEAMDSPHMSNVSWEDYAASHWEEHARMLEQRGQATRGMQIPSNSLRFVPAPVSTDFASHTAGLLPAANLVGSSAMEYSLSTSVSPGPEMISPESFTSPATPASYIPSAPDMQYQLSNAQIRHRHMQSSPSPTQTPSTSDMPRRKSAPAPSKSSNTSATSNKVTKSSPKPGSSGGPANSRSAHSAIERKYRENINNKIMELHKVLCAAAPPLFPDHDGEPTGYPYSRIQQPEEDDEGLANSLFAGQTTLPAKKADVLAGAVAYVRRSEKEKRALMERLSATASRLQQYEHAMAQSCGM